MPQAIPAHHPAKFFAPGPKTLWLKARHRFYAWYFDRKLGVETTGWIEREDLDYQHPDTKPYGPIGYEHLSWALSKIPFPANQVEFVDFGAGKGRVLVYAGMRPFRSVTGVELSAALASSAKKNVAMAQRHFRAQKVTAVEGDATRFPVTPTANVFYFFNPFDGPTLATVIENIRASVEQHPRPVFIIYFNHEHMERLIAGKSWIRKVYDGFFYPNYYCGLYRIG